MYRSIEPTLALVIGILILIVPGFLNYLVAIYLIVIGILGLMPKRRAIEGKTSLLDRRAVSAH